LTSGKNGNIFELTTGSIVNFKMMAPHNRAIKELAKEEGISAGVIEGLKGDLYWKRHRQRTYGFFFRYQKHFFYWRYLSNDIVGIVTILHERMHQIERFKDDFGT
jgi:hypothetical protein